LYVVIAKNHDKIMSNFAMLYVGNGQKYIELFHTNGANKLITSTLSKPKLIKMDFDHNEVFCCKNV